MFKRIVKKILHRLRVLNPPKIQHLPEQPKYNIGNIKYNNSRIDGLTPQLVEIGDNFISAPGSIILSHDASLFRHTKCYRVEKTVIEDDVFLGANAVVLPGIRIGKGAIVGAGAIVTKDVEAYTVVAGNPARIICTVQEYINKCKKKNVLYDTPEGFQDYWNNVRFSSEDINKFQEMVLTEYDKRFDKDSK